MKNILSLSDMGINLTTEMAELLRLSVSDRFFLGKKFILNLSNAIILNDVKLTRYLLASFRLNLSVNEKTAICIFNSFNKKLRNANSVDMLIGYFNQQDGWGDVISDNLIEAKEKGITYINLDFHPYRYADEGKPYIECWLDKEIKQNPFCPFIKDNSYDFFFDLVSCVRNHEEVELGTWLL